MSSSEDTQAKAKAAGKASPKKRKEGKSSPKKAEAKKKGGKLMVALWIVASLPIGFILWPSVVLSLPLMAPTFVAFIFELRQQKYMTRSIGFLNAVAILPTLISLWEGWHLVSHSVNLLFDAESWAFVFAGAGAGYVIFVASEWIVAAYYRATAKDRLKKIAIQQQSLTELWGEEVITPAAAQIIADTQAVLAQEEAEHEEQQAA